MLTNDSLNRWVGGDSPGNQRDFVLTGKHMQITNS